MVSRMSIPFVRYYVAAFLLGLATNGLAEPSVEQVNAIFGAPLFADELLWDDVDGEVAKRLGWPQEARTKDTSSFRLYPDFSRKFMETSAKSLVLHGAGGSPASLIIVFANKGDMVLDYFRERSEILPAGTNERAEMIRRAASKIEKQLKDSVRRDEELVSTKLKNVLGEPRRESFGQGRELKHLVSRWDWKGHAFLLAAPKGEYVILKIVPSPVADNDGKSSRVSDQELKQRLAANVEKRANGDVLVKEIPMVDQGPKGFCVPATWERCLRYLGISADMYELALAAGTGTGGGTYLKDMQRAVNDLVVRNGRRMDRISRLSENEIASCIDRGIPLMWAMTFHQSLDEKIAFRTNQRANMPETKVWNDLLKNARREARRIRSSDGEPHMCMIIGYNPLTEEIAFSDSWGPEYAERWMTLDEARAISLNELIAITW
jgi:hypothetical protein